MLSARSIVALMGGVLLAGGHACAEVTREVIFITGQAAVGFPQGAIIQSFPTAWARPWVNSRGHVLLEAVATGGGVSSPNDQGLWLATRDGLVFLLREGDPAPGISDATIRQWFVYGLTSEDEAILHVRFAGEGVSPTNDTAICRVAPGGEFVYIAREGNAVSDDPADGTWLNFVFQTTFDNRMNAHGEALISAATSVIPSGFWFTRGTEMVPLVKINDPAPGTAPGTTVTQLVQSGWTDDRTGLFRVWLAGGDAGEGNQTALIAFGESRDALVARQGSVPPGVPDGTYSSFFFGDAGGADQLLFSATLNAPGTNDNALWTGTPEGMRLLVRQGDQAPGLPAGRLLNTIFWHKAGPEGAGFVASAGGGNGVFVERDGELTLLCYTELPAPDLPQGVLYGQVSSFGNDSPIRFANFGRAAFPNNLVGTGLPGDGRYAIFQTDVAGTTRLVIRASEILATPLGARTFTNAGNVTLTPNGLMAMHAMLSNPPSMAIILAQVGCPNSACDGIDLDGDCRIGLQDLATLLGGFGRAGIDLPGDYDDSGEVDLQDLAELLAVFGQDCAGN